MSTPLVTRPLISDQRMLFLEPASHFHAVNPFDPAWEELLKASIRSSYQPGARASNFEHLEVHLTAVLGLAKNLAEGAVLLPTERAVYEGCAIFVLWLEFRTRLQALVDKDAVVVPFFDEFVERHGAYFDHPGVSVAEPGHLFSLMYQAHRAWYFPATKIRGRSPSAQRLRAALYSASIGADVAAYADGLYLRMSEIPVLITGETGTGKELAAQCVGWSRYIPIDRPTKRLVAGYRSGMHARNICEISEGLVESTLFGHKRGSFTGAVADATGYFALPGEHGSLFLDEIGELPLNIQAKLLRPIESRECLPMGATEPVKIKGRHIFATHRNLEAMCREEKFRADLFERINGVPIRMPPLRQMLAEAPDELRRYVRWFVAAKIDSPARVEAWTERIVRSIAATRPGDPWVRNLRELKHYTEQYLLTDGRMSTAVAMAPTAENKTARGGPAAPASICLPSSGILGARTKAGEISFAELIRAYVTWLYVLLGQNKAETARRTGLNWRTVSRWIDPARLVRWLARKPPPPSPT
jgi:DNA-binding NtrC family response regulator